MKRIMKWLGTKFIEGFLIVLPILLTYLMVGQLFDLLMVLAVPILDILPESALPDLWEQRMIAVGLLIVIFLLVALIAETAVGKRMGRWIESAILNRFPPYVILRSLARRLSGREVPAQLQPAIMSVSSDIRTLVFVIEEHEQGDLTVFVPLAPTPGVGMIQIVSKEKVRNLDVSMADALGSLLNWGVGTEALLKASKKL